MERARANSISENLIPIGDIDHPQSTLSCYATIALYNSLASSYGLFIAMSL